MTNAEIRAIFIEELINVAPDLEPGMIGGGDHIQDDLELDSMDVLNLVSALHKRLGVNIPEEDYPQIETADKAEAYLAARLG